LPATLFLVATPIGNLEDITLRALRVLREEVAVIACEDTRQTLKLLEHYQIRKRLVSYHEHNESTRTLELLEFLRSGGSVALLSDAGTPLISDPGYRLVTAAIEQEIPVVPLPGASAILAALAGAGLPTDSFRFIGFLPSKAGQRSKALTGLASETATVVTYESPHRILETLADIAQALGDNRPVVLCRELTKMHEEFLRGSATSIRSQLEQRGSIRGEITLVIGRGEDVSEIADPLQEIERVQSEEGLDRMAAIKIVAKRMKLPKREVYRLVAEAGSNPPGKRRD
jgi:16S rRNA (cytidine1402-2'-O)-methyltransferase